MVKLKRTLNQQLWSKKQNMWSLLCTLLSAFIYLCLCVFRREQNMHRCFHTSTKREKECVWEYPQCSHLIECSCIAVEVKKEPEPPTEVVKQEEREPATKSSAPAPPSKPPPEKRARLQWEEQSFVSESSSANRKNSSGVFLLPRHIWRLSPPLVIRSVYRRLRMNWHERRKKRQLLVYCASATFTL